MRSERAENLLLLWLGYVEGFQGAREFRRKSRCIELLRFDPQAAMGFFQAQVGAARAGR